MCVLALPGQPILLGMQQRKKDKKKEKRGEEGIQGDWLHATGSSTPVVSLCIEEGGQPHIEIIGGTWVGNACDVGAGGCHHHQDLAMVWLLRLLAKQERGCVKMVSRCVSRGCANTQDWEKRKQKTKNKKKQKQKTKRKKKKETQTYWEPIYWLHGTGSSMPVVSLWVEGHGWSHADHRPHAEAMGGHAWVMHAMWVQVVIVVKTLRWHGNLIFWPGKGGGAQGWCLGACREGAQMHRTGKKK